MPTTTLPRFSLHSTAIELHEMPKRKLADRILDEILTLRRPRSLVVETDERIGSTDAPGPGAARHSIRPSTRRQLIVE